MKTLISITGPTASGKTALSIAVAKQFGAPIVSADSVQIYRGLDIGSGKVTSEEMQGIPHYMLDVADPCEDFSAGDYGRAVDTLLPQLFQQYDVVLLVGGAGFYLNAVWEGMDDMPLVDLEIRALLNERFEKEGLAVLQEKLKEVDPVTYGVIDLQNPVRVIRALEVFQGSGKPISEFRKGKIKKEKAYTDIKIGLEMEREVLYPRINARVIQMVEDGLEQEVRSLYNSLGGECKGLGSVGYREFVHFFEGKHDRAEAIRLIQRNSRRYAKRQYTWFRKLEDMHWFPAMEPGMVLEYLKEEVGGKEPSHTKGEIND